jgi:replicative DNA helicase
MDDIQDMQGKTGLSGVPSGFASLDSYTMGWQKSDLIIIGARPSVGKTAFALNLARNAAVDHHMPVAFFSLEMSSLQLAKRLMTSESGLPADKIKGGTKLESFEWEQLESRLKNLIKAPLYIDDTPSIPIMEFRAKAKNWVKNKGVSLIMVDYLQLMQGPAELRGMREQEVAAISRTLKGTAKELNVPIIALSQLSRNAVQRQGSNSQPQLSDLRESGSIEQDADMVLFIHRPDYLGLAPSDDASNLDIGKTFVIIAKNRNGATGEIKMVFKPDQVKFMEENDTLMSDFTGATESKMNAEVGDVSPFNQGGGEFGINNDF